jgi:hypothetical protein
MKAPPRLQALLSDGQVVDYTGNRRVQNSRQVQDAACA